MPNANTTLYNAVPTRPPIMADPMPSRCQRGTHFKRCKVILAQNATSALLRVTVLRTLSVEVRLVGSGPISITVNVRNRVKSHPIRFL